MTNHLDFSNVHHHINSLFYGTNRRATNTRITCPKRVTPWLRRHDLSSVPASPLLSHQPYCAALRQDNRNTQGDVSRSAIFCQATGFLHGGEKEDGVHCCLPARMILRLHVADGGVLSLCTSVAVCSRTKHLLRLHCLTAAHNLPKLW